MTGASPDESVFKTVNGAPLKLFHFSPADAKTGDRRAAIVWIHGGAWSGGTAEGFFPHARYFAARGAVGFSVQYRLVLPDGPTVADCLADCKSAIRYIRAHAATLGVDPRRIAVLGDSAGGHLAACLGTIDGFDDPADDRRISARPDAMVLYNPVLDLTGPDWIKHIIGGAALKKNPPPLALEANDPQRALARALSPVFQVHAAMPPALVLHGLDDRTVLAEQSRRFNAAMNAAGNRSELILLEHTRHAFVVPNYTAPEPVVVDAIRFADRFLVTLGYLNGEPTLEASTPPAWPPRPAPLPTRADEPPQRSR